MSGEGVFETGEDVLAECTEAKREERISRRWLIESCVFKS